MLLSELIKDAELLNSVIPKTKDLELLDELRITNGIFFTVDGILYIGIKLNFNFHATLLCKDFLVALKELKKKCGASIEVDMVLEDSFLYIFDKKTDIEVKVEVSIEETALTKSLADKLDIAEGESITLNNEFISFLKYHYKFIIPKSIHDIFTGTHCIYDSETKNNFMLTNNNTVMVVQEITLGTEQEFVLYHNFLKCLVKINKPGILTVSDNFYTFKTNKHSLVFNVITENTLEDSFINESLRIYKTFKKTEFTHKGRSKLRGISVWGKRFDKQLDTVLKLSTKVGFTKWMDKIVLVGKIPFGYIGIMEN